MPFLYHRINMRVKQYLVVLIGSLSFFSQGFSQSKLKNMSFEASLIYTGVSNIAYDSPEASYQIGFEYLDKTKVTKGYKFFDRVAFGVSFHDNKFMHDLIYPEMDEQNRVYFSRKGITALVRMGLFEFDKPNLTWISFDYGLTASSKLDYTLKAGNYTEKGDKHIRDINLLAGFTFQWYLTENLGLKMGTHRYLWSYFNIKNKKDTFYDVLNFSVESLYVATFSIVYSW